MPFSCTNLNILGLPTDDNVQDVATPSRFSHGSSLTFPMSGDIRLNLAARTGVEFQRGMV